MTSFGMLYVVVYYGVAGVRLKCSREAIHKSFVY